MKVVKKVLKTVFAVFFALLIAVAPSLSEKKRLSRAEDEAAVVSILSTDFESVAKPDKEGVIWFNISAKSGTYDNIVVYYRTVNQTAVGGVDFTTIPTVYGKANADTNGRVTLSFANAYSELLSVQTNAGKFGTTDSKTNEKHVPQFAIEIYKIVCDGEVKNVKDNELTCVLDVEHDLTYQTYNSNNRYVFSQYLTGEKTTPYYSKTEDYILKDDPQKGKYNYLYHQISMNNKSKQVTWENDFIQTDLASGYVTFETLMSGWDDNDCVKMTLSNNYTYEGYKPYTGNSSYSVKTYSFNSSFGVNEIYPYSDNMTFDGFYQPKAMLGYTYEDIADFYARYLDYIGFSHSYVDYEQVLRNAAKYIASYSSKYKYNPDFYTNTIQYKEGNYVVFDKNLGGFTFDLADTDNYSKTGLMNIPGSIGNCFNEEFISQEYYKDIEHLAQLLFGSLSAAMEEVATRIPNSLYGDEWGYGKGIVEAYNKGFELLYPNRLYYEIPKGGLDLCMRADTKASADTGYEGLTFYYLLQDIKAPEVSGIYSTDREDDTIISVKFKEPVYIKPNSENNIKLKCLLNGYSDKVAYASLYNFATQNGNSCGAFTDTLTFRLDKKNITDDISVTNLKIAEFVGASNILDFSCRELSPQTAITKSNVVNCVYDNRIPSVENIAVDVNSPAYSHTLNVTLKNCSDSAKLFYAFVPMSEVPSEYRNKTTAPLSAFDVEYQTTLVPTGAKPSVSVTASNLNGLYCLVTLAQSGIGRISDNLRLYQNISFDNVPPTITNLTDDGGTEIHTFTFNYVEETSGLKDVYFLYSTEPWTNKDDFNGNSFKITGTASGGTYTTKPVSYQDVGVQNGETKAFYVGVCVTDNSLNTSEYVFIASPVKFSSSTSFEVITDGLQSIGDGKFIKTLSDTSSFTFDYELPSGLMVPEKFYLESICKVKTNDGEEDRYIMENQTFPSETNKDPIEITNATANITESGLYVFTFRAKFQNMDDLRVCNAQVYVYTDNDKPSQNYLNVSSAYGLITNYFSLSFEAQFVYRDFDGLLQQEFYSSKNGENKVGMETVFSNAETARKYVKFMEMQDLRLLKISSLNVTSFNYEVGYKKAETSQREAQVGDYWICYKPSSWERNYTGSWVYYYYGRTSEYSKISVDLLPSDLSNALDTVSTRIVDQYGSMKYVHQDDGNVATLDIFGSPYFANNQIHAKGETVAYNKSGDEFDVDGRPTYEGDGGIYDNLMEYDGENYFLATNYEFLHSGNNVVMYKKVDETDYKVLTLSRLSQLSDDGEAYDILEYSVFGVYKYKLFVDRKTPTVNVNYVEGNGTSKTLTLNADEHNNQSIYVTEFYIIGLNDFADSTYSYVSVFTRNGKHVVTRLMVELQSTLISLEDGSYIVEIHDRSGNSFSFSVFVNNTDLTANVKITENTSLTISVANRSAYEMEVYEIRRNGVLISSSFEDSKKFTQSGTYTFRFIDKYGNAWANNGVAFEFFRDEPNIAWKYYDNGTPYEYVPGGENQAMAITSEAEGQYTIYTSKLLQFSFPVSSGYTVEFLNDFKLGQDYSITSTGIGGIYTTVSINKLSSFRMKISYTDYPSVYSIYNCVIDSYAPSIIVSYQSGNYEGNEQGYFIKNLDNLTDGFIPENISYTENGKTVKYVTNGSSVCTEKLNFSFVESTGIRYITIYYNGKIYRTLAPSDNLVFSMNRYGDYKIVACDIVNNVSTLNFKNNHHDFTEIKTDGKDEACGHSDATVLLTEPMEVSLFISKNIFVTFKYDGYDLYKKSYVMNTDDSGIKSLGITVSDSIFNAEKAEEEKWYLLDERGFYACVTNEGNVIIKYVLPVSSTGEHEIEVRATSDFPVEPVYKKLYLCNEKTDVELYTVSGEKIATNQQGFTIYLNEGMCVKSLPDDVTVKIAYTDNNEFVDFEDIVLDTLYSFNGRYQITVENKYHNVLVYNIVLSDSFLVSVEVKYADGSTNNYGVAYGGNFYSNNSVKIVAYSQDVEFTVKRNGEIYNVLPIESESGDFYVLLSQNGSYVITVRDYCGNVWVRTCEIENHKLVLPENLIGGYNEKAKQGYTNTKLYVDTDTLNASDVKYVEVKNGDKNSVIYDLLSENAVPYNEDSFKALLGCFGDGEYEIVFKDVYGNKSVISVKYKEFSTLELSRVIRTSTDVEELSLVGIEQNGIWSNNQFTIKGSPLATLKINGNVVDGTNFVGRFTSTTKDGEQKFYVYYLDEYGFEFNFTANLLRRDVEIVLPESVTTMTIGGVITTRKPVAVKFEDANGYYVLNSGVPVEYQSGTELTDEGTYYFTVIDRAGNTSSFVIRRDTFVEYEIVEVSTGKVCISGEVLGTNRAKFAPINGDTAKLVKATLNGKETDVEDVFIGNGKWEILVADEIGNRSYFCFYMIYHEINSFDYSTPYGYKIDSVWHSVGDMKVDCTSEVINSEDGDYSRIVFSTAGVYSVVMSNVIGNVLNFGITIETEPPKVNLVGVEENGITLDDVTLKGLKEQDTVYIYKNGKLIETMEISSAKSSPVISKSGTYRVVVESRAGNTTELNFVKKYVPNMAGSLLIILLIFMASLALLIGMIYRTKIKVDR